MGKLLCVYELGVTDILISMVFFDPIAFENITNIVNTRFIFPNEIMRYTYSVCHHLRNI